MDALLDDDFKYLAKPGVFLGKAVATAIGLASEHKRNVTFIFSGTTTEIAPGADYEKTYRQCIRDRKSQLSETRKTLRDDAAQEISKHRLNQGHVDALAEGRKFPQENTR